MKMTLAERFEHYTCPEPNTGCLLWTGAQSARGYGAIWAGHGVTLGAHRVAWELARGPVPEGAVVRHKVCDNPPCCNVDHLDVGTQADNVADRVAKGRSACGEAIGYAFRGTKSSTAKLTDAIVLDCRRRAAAGEHYESLALEFGVAGNVMRLAIRGQNWSHLDPTTAVAGDGLRCSLTSKIRKLSYAAVVDCRARWYSGDVSHAALAREYGIKTCTMREAVLGITWRHVPMP